MPHYPRWTKDEEQILRKNFPKLGLNGRTGPVTQNSLLFLLPNKSWDAIKWKARQLGLKRSFKSVHAPLELSETDRGYLAGLLDGEGCISCQICHRKSGLVRYQPYVSIANTNLDVLEWVQSVTHLGHIRHLKPPSAEKRKKYEQQPWKWSFAYTWQISSMADCYRLLMDIGDVLKIKREQAKLILEFLEIESKKPEAKAARDEHTGLFLYRIAIPSTARQHEIYNKIRELNRRGKNL